MTPASQTAADSASAPTAKRSASGYERILDDLQTWLVDQRSFPGVNRNQDRFVEAVQAIDRKRERLLAPLNIVLAGGTGVGKSSLLNGLAGDEISQSAETRAFTSDYTCYFHEDDSLAIRDEVLAGGTKVKHSREDLRDKIIVDTPDFDSAEEIHRTRLQTALKHADLVIWVTTSQKYANLTGIEILKQFREGRKFIFVFTRDDEFVGDAVVDDLRQMLVSEGFDQPRIFRVSTVGMLGFKQGRSDVPQGRDDKALEQFIQSELDRKTIEILKRGNLAALVLRLITEINEKLPLNLRDQLKQWKSASDQYYHELNISMRGRLTENLRANRGFIRQLRYRFSSSYSGIFGAWLQFVYATRAIADLDYPDLFGRRRSELGAVPKIHRGEDGFAADIHELVDLYRRIEHSGRDIGLAPEVVQTRPSDQELERGLRRFYDRVDSGFLVELDEVYEGSINSFSGWFMNGTLNLVPVSWLIFIVIFWIDSHFTHQMTDRAAQPGYFTAGLLVCLFLLMACQKIAERRIGWRVDFVIEKADQIVGKAIDATIRGDIFKSRDAQIIQAEEELSQLEELQRRAESLDRGAE